MLLFKYASPDSVKNVFEREGEVSVRFGLPRTYNDPYELYLQPDAPLESEEEWESYYSTLNMVGEAPVTCFSRRPDSVVMWAHYGRDGAGICLGFDEDSFTDHFPTAFVGDIKYVDGPPTLSSFAIQYSRATGKNRHLMSTLANARAAAYFTKRADWRYEEERRVVVQPDSVENRDGILVSRVPANTLRYVIVGPKARRTVQRTCKSWARKHNVPLLCFRIGIRTYEPFFSGASASALKWIAGDFQDCLGVCAECGEPADVNEDGVCQWCSIPEETRHPVPADYMQSLMARIEIYEPFGYTSARVERKGHGVKESGGDDVIAGGNRDNTRSSSPKHV